MVRPLAAHVCTHTLSLAASCCVCVYNRLRVAQSGHVCASVYESVGLLVCVPVLVYLCVCTCVSVRLSVCPFEYMCVCAPLTQELLLILEDYWSRKENDNLKSIPIFYIGGLATKAIPVFKAYINFMNRRIQEVCSDCVCVCVSVCVCVCVGTCVDVHAYTGAPLHVRDVDVSVYLLLSAYAYVSVYVSVYVYVYVYTSPVSLHSPPQTRSSSITSNRRTRVSSPMTARVW